MAAPTSKLVAPPELRSIMEEYAYKVLKERPDDIYQFSADYFMKLNSSVKGLNSVSKDESHNEGQKREDDVAYVDESKSLKTFDGHPENEHGNGRAPNLDEDEDEGDDEIMDMKDIPKANRGGARRQSVAAESFDPEKIDDSELLVIEKTENQKARLRQAIKDIFIFRSLEPAQIPRLIDVMFEQIVEPEEVVIKQGDDGDNFYVVEKGVFEIFVSDNLYTTYEDSGSFGELALMYNTPRAATIVAKTPGILWAMDRESFLKIVLKSAFQKRRLYEAMIHSVDILQSLDEYERTRLADALFSRTYTDNQVIVKQDERGEEMFFIVEGDVVVTATTSDGAEKEVNRHKMSDYFGELALLGDGYRNATVKAAGDVKVAVLDRGSFERLMGPCVDVMKRNVGRYREQLLSILGEEESSRTDAVKRIESINQANYDQPKE